VPELIATRALQDCQPASGGGASLRAIAPVPIWSVALFPGAQWAALPAPGRWASLGEGRIVWTGFEQAFIFGTLPDHLPEAAITDQSDGWEGFGLAGPGAVAALARLVGIDLRAGAFGPGSVARTGLNHVPALILRTADEDFEIFVPRSMALTALEELTAVLARLQARAG